MIHENINLQGSFKFDVFDKNDKLVSSSDPLPNFVTNSGLSYVNFFAFADCIRYLSIGSGTGANTILNGGTVALTSGGQSGFSFIGGNSLGTNCSNARNQYTSGCGFLVTDSGVKLFRAWRVPADTSLFFDRSFTFKEYQISPGTPAKSGFLNGVTGYACHCNQSVNTQVDGLGQTLYGDESFDFYTANTGICNATGAFTRILKDVNVVEDQYLIVNYILNIGIDTGVKRFQITPTLTNPYSGLSGEGYNNWKYVSGKHSIIHAGTKLINDNSVTSINQADQINDSYIFRYGESYIPELGIPMEPSCPLAYRFGYISNDNLLAIVNPTGNGTSSSMDDTGLYQPYNLAGREFPNGLISYHKNGLTSFYRLKPRSERNVNTAYANSTNYKSAASLSFTNFFGTNQSFSPITLGPPSNGISDSFDSYISTGRSRSKTLSFQFVDPSLISRFPVRAMVIGYKPLSSASNAPYNYYPVIDCIFAAIDTGLNFVNDPFINTGNFTYAKPRDLLTNDSLGISGGYNYMDENNILQFQFKLNWSSPCNSGVQGCS